MEKQKRNDQGECAEEFQMHTASEDKEIVGSRSFKAKVKSEKEKMPG